MRNLHRTTNTYSLLTWPIDQHNWLTLKFLGPQKEIMCCEWITITLHTAKGKSYILSDDVVLGDMQELKWHIKALKKGKMELSKLITEDIGLLWNNELHATTKGSKEESNVQKYLLWCTPSDIGNSTWLYTENGKIIFKITPNYPWHFTRRKKGDIFFSYAEFVKKYQPYIILELAPEVINQWQRKAQNIVRTALANFEKHNKRES